jgi:predicted transcriptional regulator
MQGKEHIPTEESRKLVKSLAAVGTRYVDIAHKLEITDDTLRKHYKEELESGRIDANAQIANTLFQQAKKGNMTAAIFWLKTRAGWKETQVTELTGEDGGPIKGLEVRFVKPE